MTDTAALLRTFCASVTVLAVALCTLYVSTEGGKAFTTESLRRSAVDRAPQQIHDFALRDMRDTPIGLHTLLAQQDRIWLVDFVYTRCQSVCSVLGSVYQQLQQEIQAQGLSSRVGLLSISFDAENDHGQALQDYAKRMRMAPDAWRIVTLKQPGDRQRLLDEFGIMVIPAPLGEYEHNAAIHLMNASGQLVKIMDYQTPALALATALELTP